MDGFLPLPSAARLALALSVALAAPATVGCAAEAESAKSHVEAFTVANGDRFVVSANPERIVLRKHVDGVDFPFDEASLKGKAVLVHPVVKRAEEGVYARAVDVRSEGSTYVIDAEPLTLQEMAEITEDDIVRIYIDTKRSARNTEDDGVLQPATLQPLGKVSLNGFAFNGFNLGTGLDLASPFFLRPGVSFSHQIEEVSLEPRVLADYTSEGGLELGFRASFAWKSKLTVGGRVAGEFFRSPTIKGPPLVVFVPIGVVPVPVTIQGSAWISCSAALTNLVSVSVELEASAEIGGSLRANPSADTSPSEWVTEGSWPAEASGSASATPSLDTTVGATVSCAVPRVEVHASVAGIAGPYMAIAPMVILNQDGTSFETKLSAGVGSSLLGPGRRVELTLYTWKP